MASSGFFAVEAFETNQVSLLVSADDTWRFFEDHGFFYQENKEIGRSVEELYNSGNFRNPEVKLHYTRVLKEDSVSGLHKPLCGAYLPEQRIQSILDRYPAELPFRIPWGTTPQRFYNWVKKKDPRADNDLTVYLLGPASKWRCCAGSHKLETDGEYDSDGNYALEDTALVDYPMKEFIMRDGGV